MYKFVCMTFLKTFLVSIAYCLATSFSLWTTSIIWLPCPIIIMILQEWELESDLNTTSILLWVSSWKCECGIKHWTQDPASTSHSQVPRRATNTQPCKHKNTIQIINCFPAHMHSKKGLLATDYLGFSAPKRQILALYWHFCVILGQILAFLAHLMPSSSIKEGPWCFPCEEVRTFILLNVKITILGQKGYFFCKIYRKKVFFFI